MPSLIFKRFIYNVKPYYQYFQKIHIQCQALLSIFSKDSYTMSSLIFKRFMYNGSSSIWASTQENLSSRFGRRSYPNHAAQLQRLTRKLHFFLVASLDIILSNKRITKALIRLGGCAGWSAPLLFTNPEDRCSHIKSHMTLAVNGMFNTNTHT